MKQGKEMKILNEYSLLKIYHSFILPFNYSNQMNSIMNLS